VPGKRGKLIVVEGPDGAGKTTLCRGLVAELISRGIRTKLLREPGGTALSEQIRAILKGDAGDAPLDARAETLLFCAARAQLCREVVEPALGRGEWVLLDRFHGSTIVYQGRLRGLGESDVAAVSAFATADLPEPDLTLILDVSAETARRRITEREGGHDRIERDALERLEELIAGYSRLPGEHVNAEGAPREVLERAMERVQRLTY